jgi:hypothetical protein
MGKAIQEVATLKREARQKSSLVGPAVKKFADLGVNRKALMRCVKDRLRDEDEVLAENRAYIQMMAIEKHLVTEEDLFGALDLSGLGAKAAETHYTWAAQEEGYAAGLEGGDDESAKRYPAGSPLQAAWSKGHKQGASARAAQQDEGTEVASVRKERTPRAAASPPAAAPPAPPPDAEPMPDDGNTWPLDATMEAAKMHDDGALFDEKVTTLPARKPKGPAPTPPEPAAPPRRGRPPGKGKVATATSTRH